MASNRFLKASTKFVNRQFFAKGDPIFFEGDPSGLTPTLGAVENAGSLRFSAEHVGLF